MSLSAPTNLKSFPHFHHLLFKNQLHPDLHLHCSVDNSTTETLLLHKAFLSLNSEYFHDKLKPAHSSPTEHSPSQTNQPTSPPDNDTTSSHLHFNSQEFQIFTRYLIPFFYYSDLNGSFHLVRTLSDLSMETSGTEHIPEAAVHFVHVWSLADRFAVPRLKEAIQQVPLSASLALECLIMCAHREKYISQGPPEALVNRLVDVVADGFDELQKERMAKIADMQYLLKVLQRRSTNLTQKHDELELSFGSVENCEYFTSQVVIAWLQENASLWNQDLKPFREYLCVDQHSAIYLHSHGIDCTKVICEHLASPDFNLEGIDKLPLQEFVHLMSNKNIHATEDKIFSVVIQYADLWKSNHDGSISEDTVSLLLSTLNVEYLSNASLEILLHEKEYFSGDALVKNLFSKWISLRSKNPNIDLSLTRFERNFGSRGDSQSHISSQGHNKKRSNAEESEPQPKMFPPPSPIVDTRQHPSMDRSLLNQSATSGIHLPPGPKPHLLQGDDTSPPPSKLYINESFDSVGHSARKLGFESSMMNRSHLSSSSKEAKQPTPQVKIGDGKLKIGRLHLEYVNSRLTSSGFSFSVRSNHEESSYTGLQIQLEHIQESYKCTLAQVLLLRTSQQFNFNKKYYNPAVDEIIVISMEDLPSRRFRALVRLFDSLSPTKAKESSSFTLNKILKAANRKRQKFMREKKEGS